MPNPVPFGTFTHDVIFIDAIPGSGKSLLGPIVSSFNNVERQTMGLYTLEHLLASNYLNLIDSQLAQQLIQQLVAYNHYNMFIGRNVNMKIGDISGPLLNPNRIKYFLRLITGSSGSDADIEMLNNLNISPLIKIHASIYNLSLLRSAFTSRLKFIELVRYPLDTINSWINAQNYYRNGVRGFSLRLENNHIIYDYIDDLSIPNICPLYQYNALFNTLREAHEENSQDFLLLPFEHFLFNSKTCFHLLSQFLSRKPIFIQLRKSAAKQKCDRYKYICSNQKLINFQLYTDEPFSLANSRDETLSRLKRCYPSSDVKVFIEHIEWYNEFILSFSSQA